MFFTENPNRRKVAVLTAALFAWLSVGPSAGAAYARTHTKAKGHSRALTAFERSHIRGAIPTHALSLDPASGSTYSWEGSVGGTNTGNGNKLTTLPIVGWTARGGLPVNFTIYHNSQGSHDAELGKHWTHSFDIYLMVDSGTGDVAMHWGNDLSYVFTKNIDGSFSPPTGIYDSLAYDSGSSTYTLTTKSQVKYAFQSVSGEWMCKSIKDRNNNTLTINHNSTAQVTSVVDANSRTLSFSYDGNGRITSVTDPASRSFSFAYTSGKLASVTFPTASSQTPVIQYGYDSGYRITSVTDPRGKVWSYSYNSDG
uniref:RHS repeat domain-containing protein n=1 Tax=Armatimonas sp. TaxID=1872638 RepID=UPI00286CCB19